MKAHLARFVISLIAMLIALITFIEMDVWLAIRRAHCDSADIGLSALARRSFAAWPTRRQFGAIWKSGSAISISSAGFRQFHS